jgi:hypothetical protein
VQTQKLKNNNNCDEKSEKQTFGLLPSAAASFFALRSLFMSAIGLRDRPLRKSIDVHVNRNVLTIENNNNRFDNRLKKCFVLKRV